MTKKDYSKSVIYSIRNDIDTNIYIGSTTQELSKRMADHRYNHVKNSQKLYDKMRGVGVEHFYIELIEEYPCSNLQQLRKREGHYIRELGTLNSRVAGRTREQWRVDNKPKIALYEEQRRDTQKQYHREYFSRQDVKEHRKRIATQLYSCSCGRTFQICEKARHEKSKYHQNFLAEK